MYVHIDRKRKLPVTVLLKALGYATEKAILELFYPIEDDLDIGQRQQRRRTRPWRAGWWPRTWSIPRPARSWSRPTRS